MAKRRAAMMLAVIQAELDHEKLFAKRLKQAEEYKKKDASEEGGKGFLCNEMFEGGA